MQQAMQADAAVFRTGETLQQGVDKLRAIEAAGADIKTTDRGLIWNTDLMETLEYDNLIAQAMVTIEGGLNPDGIARRPRARGLPQPRRRQLD